MSTLCQSPQRWSQEAAMFLTLLSQVYAFHCILLHLVAFTWATQL